MSTTTTNNYGEQEPTAKVSTTEAGEVLGCCLFLNEKQLRKLGVDEADDVKYVVAEGGIQLEVSKDE